MAGILRSGDTVEVGEQGPILVSDALKAKHPPANPALSHTLIDYPDSIPTVPPVVFDQITGGSIRQAALRTKGAHGPSGMDAHSWRRLCTSFKAASDELCNSLALVARRLCTDFVHPAGIAPFLACRLIALDKSPGIRPIGICEVPRRIIAKAILFVTKGDVEDAAGSTQMCAGQLAGIEAAVHAVHSIFSNAETEAILMVDASNAFNSMNRTVALHNVRILCPSLATVLINTYRGAAELFLDSQTILSKEGTTQGDPLSMPFYALATVPLIDMLKQLNDALQVWYADDAAAAGKLSVLKSWWDDLLQLGPAFGYFVNAKKSWLVTKEEHLNDAKFLFQDSNLNITAEGRPYLGAAIGSVDYVKQWLLNKVREWEEQLLTLAEVARSQPQASYAAFIHGYTHKFTYLCRTNPDIDQLLEPIEKIIRTLLIPTWTGQDAPNDVVRSLFALPVRLGGLGISNLTVSASFEYTSSVEISAALSQAIVDQQPEYTYAIYEDQCLAKDSVKLGRRKRASDLASSLKSVLPPTLLKAMELAQEKGSSSWLSALPLEQYGLTLHKGAFRDALALRYGWTPANLPTHCACGAGMSVGHALSCPKGGLPIARHNEVRDTVAGWLGEVCNNTTVEPTLQPIAGEVLRHATAIAEEGARLDIATDGFWGGPFERAFFDVCVFNPHAPSNSSQSLAATYRKHEKRKCRAYEQRVREIEHGSFTPLIMSATGGVGAAANVCYKRLASLLSVKWNMPYSCSLAWIRCKLSFSLLRSSIQCLRGSRSSPHTPVHPCHLVAFHESGITVTGH